MAKKDDVLNGSLGARLGAATDELNRKIREFEKVLTDLGLGISVSFELDPIDPHVCLSFSKWTDSEWRIQIVNANLRERQLLQSVSRDQRLKAVAAFPSLVELLVSVADDEMARVNAASKTIDELMASLAERKS